MTRRRFLRITATAAATLAGAGLLRRGLSPVIVSDTRLLMGTIATLTVVADEADAGRAALAATLQRMTDLESVLSRHQPQSQVSLLNRHGVVSEPDADLLHVLRQALEVSRWSGGAFDVTMKPLLDLYQRHAATGTLPAESEIAAARQRVGYVGLSVDAGEIALRRQGMGVTLDGIAKGYIVDAAVAVLRSSGFDNVLVEAGGDLSATGQRDGRPWRVGVQSPRNAGRRYAASFTLQNAAAATSGDYMQPFTADWSSHHIIDPRTGYSPPTLASVTATAPTAGEADALATALMVLGVDTGMALLAERPGCAALFVTKDMQVLRSDGFEA
jgi:thiamine biosynthesis lipoprotein